MMLILKRPIKQSFMIKFSWHYTNDFTHGPRDFTTRLDKSCTSPDDDTTMTAHSTHLHIPVNDPIHLKVIVILTKRVDQLLSHLVNNNGTNQATYRNTYFSKVKKYFTFQAQQENCRSGTAPAINIFLFFSSLCFRRIKYNTMYKYKGI